MKRFITFVLIWFYVFQLFSFSSFANDFTHLDRIVVTTNENVEDISDRASGLIFSYSLSIARQGNTTLVIGGETVCDSVVVKCGFKNLKVERRQNSTSSWSEYYNYGNLYYDTNVYNLHKELQVDPGYQYRVTCKHYAKKNILNTQTISNTSNIVTF